MIDIRIPGYLFQSMREDFQKYYPKESWALGIFRKLEYFRHRFFILSGIVIPDENEADRTPVFARPKMSFVKELLSPLRAAISKGEIVVASIHVHPFSRGIVRFSGIDDYSMKADSEIFKENFNGAKFLSIVFNRDCSAFDASLASDGGMAPVDRLTVVGNRHVVMHRKEAQSGVDTEIHNRALLIPGYDLSLSSNLTIGIVGLGGLGSQFVESIAMQGFAENARLFLFDKDKIEVSNLSRIPYATKNDVGKFKVNVAAEYVRRVRPNYKVIPIPMPCYHPISQKMLASCDIIMEGTDSEFARHSLNHLAASFISVLVSCGSGVIIKKNEKGEKHSIAGGQARLFVPGTTPCLLCNGRIDMDRMYQEITGLFASDESKKVMREHGYLDNQTGEDIPDPSVYDLNKHVATIGMSQITQYLFSGNVSFHMAYFSLERLEILKSASKSQPDCPVCGNNGVIASGKLFDIEKYRHEPALGKLPKASTSNRKKLAKK